jgi:hypothetical protein
MVQRIENRTGKKLFEKTGMEGIKPRLRRTLIAPFGIIGMKITPAEARQGEAITISFDAMNATDFTSIYPVTLKVNGEVVAAEVISLPHNTIMPMKFTLANTQAGAYNVEVNETAGTLTITGDAVGQELANLEGVKPDLVNVVAEIESATPVPVKPVQQKQGLSVKDITPVQDEPQEVINNVAGGIETGLDKIGDGIILAIDKMLSAPGALLRHLKRK